MASSSSSSWRYHVFPSFSGQDVRKSFLSHLLRELGRKSIDTFIDNSIERSLPIDPALLLAIKESKISIVIFSKNYASSTWCLNELVEIHKCFKELNQMVIPIFYDVVPSDVRKQTGKFGELFEETCEGKPEDHKQRWIQALRDVAKMAGYDLLTWDSEANLIESITNYVSNKLFTPSSDVGDLVGLEAHLESLTSMLCLESEEARMVGIVGPSGIGKSTIGGALYSQHFSKFHHHAIVTYKRTINDDYGMKLSWEQQFLSKILGQNDIKIDNLGEVEKRLKHKKVLIVLDDVVELELLKTLVGKTEWFGPGSRIIVITQNRQLLKAHEIDHIHVVEFPSEGIALEMLCRYAFGKKSPPDGFRELAVEVAKLAGYLPLGLCVLGSSLKGKGKDEWVEMMPRLRNDLGGRIEKTLRDSYDRLDKKDKELFLSIACVFKGMKVSVIKDLFGSVGLRMLADKFLIRITSKEYKFRRREKTPEETLQMHDLLQKLGIEIDCEESERQPSRRRFLTNAEYIRDVLTDKNGTKTVLGISLKVTEPFSIDENSFKGMPNIQYIIIHHNFWIYPKDGEIRLDLPQGLSYLPRNLKLLEWNDYRAKCLPSNFNAKYLVILRMKYSKLEKLWEGNQPLGSLKKMDMKYSHYLKEIPDLSNAINLEVLNLEECRSLVTHSSSFQSLESLVTLNLSYCTNLTEIPDLSNAINLEVLNLQGCKSLVKLPSSFQSLESLVTLNLSYCTNLTEIPDLSNSINLEVLNLQGCKSLVTLYVNIEKRYHVEKRSMSYFNFSNCSKLDGDARELILRSCFKFMVLPGGEVPTYFKHRASGNKLAITLPQSSLSQEFLRFQACVVVGHSIKDIDAILNVHLYFNDEYEYEYEVINDGYDTLFDTVDHLFFCSFKFRPKVLPYKLDFNDFKFKFSSSMVIKGCGVQLLSVSPSPDVSNGSSETEYNQLFGEKSDVVETGRSKRRMRMTSGTSEEYSNLPFGQIVETGRSKKRMRMISVTSVADTGLTSLEVSSVFSYSCVEGEALITELQDADIPIVDKPWKERAFKLSESLPCI